MSGGGVVGTPPPTRVSGVPGAAEVSGELLDVAVRLDYMVSQITPEEFRWQDANYDRDSALGRELLFLIADTGGGHRAAATAVERSSSTAKKTACG